MRSLADEKVWSFMGNSGIAKMPQEEVTKTVTDEIEGGIYVNGRHNRAAGFAADLEMYLEATLAGWRVIRLGPDEITFETVGRLIALVGT